MDSKVIERLVYGVVGFVILAAFMIAYEPEPPETVWVPGENFEQSLTISIESPQESYKIGEWIELNAERRSGPWIEIPSDEKPSGAHYWTSPPPDVETDIEASVHWFAQPSETAEFNLPTTDNLNGRRVRFTEPGTYTVRAESENPEPNNDKPVKSNSLLITIGH